jgi:DNA-binding MarR family transcriptional regulator
MARRPVTQQDYEMLAAFRLALARFLFFSEAVSARAGLTPRQYQALLAMMGHGGEAPLSVGDLAQRLHVHHHSAVGLLDRLEALGLAERLPGQDRRRVHVRPTARGRRRVAALAAVHRDELRRTAGELRAALDGLLSGRRGGPRTPAA